MESSTSAQELEQYGQDTQSISAHWLGDHPFQAVCQRARQAKTTAPATIDGFALLSTNAHHVRLASILLQGRPRRREAHCCVSRQRQVLQRHFRRAGTMGSQRLGNAGSQDPTYGFSALCAPAAARNVLRIAIHISERGNRVNRVEDLCLVHGRR